MVSTRLKKYAQVKLDHVVVDLGECLKNVGNYHADFHAKPQNLQKFEETKVTKSPRPVSLGTWQSNAKQLHSSREVNTSDEFFKVFLSCCLFGVFNFSVIDCKSVVVVKGDVYQLRLSVHGCLKSWVPTGQKS